MGFFKNMEDKEKNCVVAAKMKYAEIIENAYKEVNGQTFHRADEVFDIIQYGLEGKALFIQAKDVDLWDSAVVNVNNLEVPEFVDVIGRLDKRQVPIAVVRKESVNKHQEKAMAGLYSEMLFTNRLNIIESLYDDFVNRNFNSVEISIYVSIENMILEYIISDDSSVQEAFENELNKKLLEAVKSE